MIIRYILVASPLRIFALFAVKFFRWNKTSVAKKYKLIITTF